MKIKKLKDIRKYLPKFAYGPSGRPMEPINLIITGNLQSIEDHFLDRGWTIAQKLDVLTAAKAALASIFNRSYPDGPMYPGFIGSTMQKLGLERATDSQTFRRRHHLRLWPTRLRYKGHKVWVGSVSYDQSIGVDASGLIPTHHIAPTLSWEEKFLAHSLGIHRPSYLHVSQPFRGRVNNGDDYFYDGRALVLDLSKVSRQA